MIIDGAVQARGQELTGRHRARQTQAAGLVAVFQALDIQFRRMGFERFHSSSLPDSSVVDGSSYDGHHSLSGKTMRLSW